MQPGLKCCRGGRYTAVEADERWRSMIGDRGPALNLALDLGRPAGIGKSRRRREARGSGESKRKKRYKRLLVRVSVRAFERRVAGRCTVGVGSGAVSGER